MKTVSLLTLVILLSSFYNQVPNETTRSPETYCNPRFGYCFTYDANIFHKIPAGINADGITITNNKGTVFLESYGSFNPYRLKASELLTQNLAYLVRNEPSDKYTLVHQHKTENNYILVIKTDDAYIQQELMLEGMYYKMLTVKVSRSKKEALAYNIFASTHFVPSAAMAYR